MSDIKAKLTFATGIHCDAALVDIESNSEQMVSDDIYDCGVYDWIAYNLEIEIPKCSILTINVDVAPSFWDGDIDEINYSIVGNVDIKPINNHDRMVEEISELKEFATMVANGMNEDPEAAVVHLRIHSREAKKLIAKLNQEGEE